MSLEMDARSRQDRTATAPPAPGRRANAQTAPPSPPSFSDSVSNPIMAHVLGVGDPLSYKDAQTPTHGEFEPRSW